tara:strand:- start:20 stop:1351 length:1332 start_codon:yes stop_codon:yes gene_type:complete
MINKPMDEAWVINKDNNEISDYLKMKQEFEKDNSHFYLIDQKRYFIKKINENGLEYYVPHTASEFTNALCHLRCDEKSFVSMWFLDSTKLSYNNFTFDLKMTKHSNYLNLWTGFEILKSKPLENTELLFENWDRYMNVISGNDTLVKDYMNYWIATIMKTPWNPNIVMLLLQSNIQGSGKSTLGLALAAIMGDNSYYQSSQGFSGLFPKDGFTYHLKNCFIYNADEVDGSDSRQNIANLKQFLTTKTISINEKGKCAYDISNKINVIGTSNGLNPMPIGEGDRRILPIEISEELVGNVDFWNNFYNNILGNKEACRSLFDYYCSFDLSKWNSKIIPQTSLKNILREASKDPIEDIIIEQQEFLKDMIVTPSTVLQLLNLINKGLEKRKLLTKNSVQIGIILSKNTFFKKLFTRKHTKTGNVFLTNPDTYNTLFECQLDGKDIL